MYRDAYRQRRSIVVTLLVMLFILAAIGALYFLIEKTIVNNKMLNIDTLNYSAEQIISQKGKQYDLSGTVLSANSQEVLSDDVYSTPLGFSIISYSEKWTGQKLVDIYNELLNNTHGEEIEYVSKVVIYPGASELGAADSNVAGAHSTMLEQYSVFFDIPAIVPKSLLYTIHSTRSTIELYNMDEYETVNEAARTITHEYGHHYTMHYFMQDNDAVLESEYYNLRGFSEFGNDVFFDTEDEYFINHEWSIYEIAAEDYVQLLGSSTVKQPKEFYDVYDLLLSYDDGEYYTEWSSAIFNVYPQENIFIPLADEVEGLRNYYYSFVNKEFDNYELLKNPNFEIKMEKYTNLGETYYNIMWQNTCKDENAMYTLICYNTDGSIYTPVRTVYGNDKPIAKVGTVSRVVGTKQSICSNSIIEEDRYFKLYLLLPDGRMQSSELFYADF